MLHLTEKRLGSIDLSPTAQSLCENPVGGGIGREVKRREAFEEGDGVGEVVCTGEGENEAVVGMD